MKIYQGMDTPFEYIRMTIPKRKLSVVAPGLVDDLENGRNKIYTEIMGRSTYILYSGGSAKVSKNGSYELVAYCKERQISECQLTSDIYDTPMQIIINLMTADPEFSFVKGFKYPISQNDIITNVASSEQGICEVEIKAGVNAWFAIQMCALMMGARVWFANDKMYIIDYRKASARSGPYYSYGNVSLYSRDSESPLYNRMVDVPSIGESGSTVINTVEVRHNLLDDGKYIVTVDPTTSRSSMRYGEQSLASPLDLSGINAHPRPGSGATEEELSAYQDKLKRMIGYIGKTIIDYRAESQQSIEFTCKELFSRDGEIMWAPAFEPACYADSLRDPINEVNIDNYSVLDPGTRLPQKLYLFSMVREYPDCVTTYKFGQLASIDLESNNSYLMGR